MSLPEEVEDQVLGRRQVVGQEPPAAPLPGVQMQSGSEPEGAAGRDELRPEPA